MRARENCADHAGNRVNRRFPRSSGKTSIWRSENAGVVKSRARSVRITAQTVQPRERAVQPRERAAQPRERAAQPRERAARPRERWCHGAIARRSGENEQSPRRLRSTYETFVQWPRRAARRMIGGVRIAGLIVIVLVLARASFATAADGATQPTTQPAATQPSLFRDAEDGCFDVSNFLSTRVGFLPIAMPIPDPAVGYGFSLGLSIFHDHPQVVNYRDSCRG
jgi:hypothetical protein